MFDPDSRYASLPTSTWTDASGREVVYVQRRLRPRYRDLQPVADLPLSEGDRLDLMATRVIGDPLRWWQIADSNDPLNPDDLTAQPGSTVHVAVPKV